MEKLKFYSESSILMMVEFICVAFWTLFILSFVLALGTDGPAGDFLPMAILLVKNHPVLAVISIVLALHLLSKVDKI